MWQAYQNALHSKPYRRYLGQYMQHMPLDFSSNDYLGLAHEPSTQSFLHNIAHQAQQLGLPLGATGARLLSGQHAIFDELECHIAKATQRESSLLFSTGFAANMGALHALLQPKNSYAVIDKRNHASVYDAIAWAKTPFARYRHGDMDHLKHQLKKIRADMPDAHMWIITESIFGMDGDAIDLEKMLQIAHDHQARIYLDEAHAIGVYGQDGYGMMRDCPKDAPVVGLGTFGKALGLAGAYIAGPKVVCDYLVNFCHSFIYSTMLSPRQAYCMLKVWESLPTPMMQAKRTHLQNVLQIWHDAFYQECIAHAAHPLLSLHGQTHIQILKYQPCASMPLIKAHDFLSYCHQFLQGHGIRLAYIQPPTVPAPCLKINVCAHHTADDVLTLAKTLSMAIQSHQSLAQNV